MDWETEEEAPPPPLAVPRRPLLGFLPAILAGTGAGLMLPPTTGLWLVIAALLLLLAMPLLRSALSIPLLWGITLLLAAANASLEAHSPSRRALSRIMARPEEFVGIIGMATDDEERMANNRTGQSNLQFPLQLEGINRTGTWQCASGRMLVRMKGAAEHAIRYGDRVYLRGLVRQNVPGKRGPIVLPCDIMELDGADVRRLSTGNGGMIKAWCLQGRRAAFDALGYGITAFSNEVGMTRSLLLGYRRELPPESQKDFSVTGTIHIFAISGTHVALVAVLLAGALRTFQISRPHWFLVLFPMLGLYTVATGAAASAVRAFVMAVTFWLASFIGRKPDNLSSLSLAAIIMLAIAPAQLADMGFILSFTAVAGLILLYPPLQKAMLRPFQPDPWQLPASPAPTALWRRWLAGPVSLLAASLACWLATTPQTVFFFNLFSPIALAMNLLVVPAAFVIMLAGFLSMLAGLLSVDIAEIFNHANRVFAAGLMWATDWAARIPGGHCFVRTPPAWVAWAWYAALPLGLVWGRRSKWALAGLALLVAAAVGGWYYHDQQEVSVQVLNVGEGQAVLLRDPGGAFLFDTGPSFMAPRLLSILRREGINRLRGVVLSHADVDHIGALRELLAALPVAKVYLPPVAGRSMVYEKTLRALAEQGIPTETAAAGFTCQLRSGVSWEVLGPGPKRTIHRADEGSLVIRLARAGTALLLMHDAPSTTEQQLLRESINPAAAILVVGQHGDEGSTTPAWLEAVNPADAIISVGAYNREGHPSPVILERLWGRHICVWRTDQSGTIFIRLHARPAPPRQLWYEILPEKDLPDPYGP